MQRTRPGGVYFLVLAAAVILSALALGLAYQMLQYRQGVRAAAAVRQARLSAELGIRHALYFTRVQPNWRNQLNNGRWLSNVVAGDALYNVSGEDPLDGNLNNGDADPVLLTCTAAVGPVSRTVRVRTRNQPSPLLSYAVAAGGNLDIGNRARITGDVTSNASIDKSGADTYIFGNAEACGTIAEQSNISGVIAPGSPAKTFPNPLDVFNYYTARATAIPFTSTLAGVLLSPTSNPFSGPLNPDGLYKINCANRTITIKDCRIVGTLLLTGVKSGSKVESAVSWRPARSDYPALLFDGGSVDLGFSGALQETKVHVDLSLPTEPGFGSQSDTYPSEIAGLVYGTGDLKYLDEANVRGVTIVTGVFEVTDDVQCAFDAVVRDSAPPGFTESYLAPIAGTWQEIVP